ncbi:MAG: glycosyltransferase family 1 protein, partial [Thermoprotei archaeon]
MRILWYNWRCIKHPLAGGAEVYTHEIARRLAREGHEV